MVVRLSMHVVCNTPFEYASDYQNSNLSRYILVATSRFPICHKRIAWGRPLIRQQFIFQLSLKARQFEGSGLGTDDTSTRPYSHVWHFKSNLTGRSEFSTSPSRVFCCTFLPASSAFFRLRRRTPELVRRPHPSANNCLFSQGKLLGAARAENCALKNLLYSSYSGLVRLLLLLLVHKGKHWRYWWRVKN